MGGRNGSVLCGEGMGARFDCGLTFNKKAMYMIRRWIVLLHVRLLAFACALCMKSRGRRSKRKKGKETEEASLALAACGRTDVGSMQRRAVFEKKKERKKGPASELVGDGGCSPYSSLVRNCDPALHDDAGSVAATCI